MLYFSIYSVCRFCNVFLMRPIKRQMRHALPRAENIPTHDLNPITTTQFPISLSLSLLNRRRQRTILIRIPIRRRPNPIRVMMCLGRFIRRSRKATDQRSMIHSSWQILRIHEFLCSCRFTLAGWLRGGGRGRRWIVSLSASVHGRVSIVTFHIFQSSVGLSIGKIHQEGIVLVRRVGGGGGGGSQVRRSAIGSYSIGWRSRIGKEGRITSLVDFIVIIHGFACTKIVSLLDIRIKVQSIVPSAI